VELRFSAEAQDYENAHRSSPRQVRTWEILYFALTFVPLFFAGVGLVGAGFPLAGWVCVGLSITIAIATYEIPRVRRRRQFRTSPSAAEERVIKINETGVATVSPNVSAQYGWQAFTRYRETDLSFLLFGSPYVAGVWIPKRVMSPEQIEELRGILNARLPTRV
jgi:YcxB-like protein